MTRPLFACLVLGLAAATAAPIEAQVIPYDFTTVDIPRPGPPGPPRSPLFPIDINNRGELLTNTGFEAVIARWNGERLRITPFSCTPPPFLGTIAEAINNSGQLVGWCNPNDGGPANRGFVRNRNGLVTFLHMPGADGTNARGINDNGVVVGQFFGPLEPGRGGALSYRFHCFTYDPATGEYTQIDFPRPDTYVDCRAITNNGRVIGEYAQVTTGNDILEHGWFVYDTRRRTFLLDFPLSFDHLGGPVIALADINNRGDIVLERTGGQPGDGWNGLFLFRDGTFWTIEPPADWLAISVAGISNDGRIVGTYRIPVPGGDPLFPFESHGFVASPRFPEFEP
jgi:hypothetical protein